MAGDVECPTLSNLWEGHPRTNNACFADDGTESQGRCKNIATAERLCILVAGTYERHCHLQRLSFSAEHGSEQNLAEKGDLYMAPGLQGQEVYIDPFAPSRPPFFQYLRLWVNKVKPETLFSSCWHGVFQNGRQWEFQIDLDGACFFTSFCPKNKPHPDQIQENLVDYAGFRCPHKPRWDQL